MSAGWRLFDDSHVTSVSEKSVMTPAAYLLFYRRRERPLLVPPRHLPDSGAESASDDDDDGSQDAMVDNNGPRTAFGASLDAIETKASTVANNEAPATANEAKRVQPSDEPRPDRSDDQVETRRDGMGVEDSVNKEAMMEMSQAGASEEGGDDSSSEDEVYSRSQSYSSGFVSGSGDTRTLSGSSMPESLGYTDMDSVD